MPCAQGGGNAGPEQENKLEDGLARVPLAWHLLVSGRYAAVAPEDLLREKEAAVVPQLFTIAHSKEVARCNFFCVWTVNLMLQSLLVHVRNSVLIHVRNNVCHTREMCFVVL